MVDIVKGRGASSISLEQFKSSLNLPVDKLPELEEIVSIYERLVKKFDL